jgi:hypothetical protein
MSNITVKVGDDVYRRARVWAAQRDTSISAVVQYILETLPGIGPAARAFPLPNTVPATKGKNRTV